MLSFRTAQGTFYEGSRCGLWGVLALGTDPSPLAQDDSLIRGVPQSHMVRSVSDRGNRRFYTKSRLPSTIRAQLSEHR
jgi:hypothetical protein